MVGKKLYTYEFTLTQCRVPPFIAKIQLHFKNSLGCRGQQHLKNVFYMSSCYFLFISLNYSYTNTHFSFNASLLKRLHSTTPKPRQFQITVLEYMAMTIL